MNIVENVYRDRDNTVDLRLKADDVAIDLSSITKMELIGDGWSINSVSSPTLFDFQKGDGIVALFLGKVADIKSGRGVISIIVYDNDNPNGINWGKFSVTVK